MNRGPASEAKARPHAPILTVSQLLLRASNALVAELGSVAVEGEVSSFHHQVRSGHMYWTLKDAASEVRCVMFRSDNRRLAFVPADGLHVVVIARPMIYPGRGQFQLQVTDVMPQGRGALHLRFEELRKSLAAEGLFDSERKRALPFWPRRIGVVTSGDGAALRDIVTVVRRRAPGTRIVLFAVPVQGPGAAAEIARGIGWFAAHPEAAQVLIVGRGGGSLEDLWAFNEEVVVRAIVRSPVPVVSAVGHETDTTLADFAADLRAPTPSAAGEHVVPETREIARAVVGCFRRLSRAVERQRIRRVEEALLPIKRYGFRRIRDRLLEVRQRWSEGTESLATVGGRLDALRLQSGEARLALVVPVSTRFRAAERSLEITRGVAREIARRFERVQTRHQHSSERLQAVSPLAILDRGYAIVTGPDGRAARDAARLEEGDPLSIRLARGRVAARVTETEGKEPE